MIADIRDPQAVTRALEGVDAVIHLVALVGVGQSMYQMAEYTSVNNYGTAALLEALSNHPVDCLVVASSMSVYGEGLYRSADGTLRTAQNRSLSQLKAGDWEIREPSGVPLIPVPTPEGKAPDLASVYALSKYDQERMSVIVGRSYGIRTIALRFFNTYGPYQALSNPYTGVLSNFAARVMNGNPPLIFEDGLQKRDFVSVYDVAAACRMALECEGAAGGVFNISSGRAMTVKEIAEKTIQAVGTNQIEPEITGRYRAGDIRHCFADITCARTVLGWEPKVDLKRGLEDLADWLQTQSADDRGLEARAELAVRGLIL